MTSPTAPSSPPPSPQAPSSGLHLPAISRILLWNARRQSKSPALEDGPAPVAAASTSSPPPSPKKDVKTHHIECSSGAELKTHGRLVDGKPECRKSDEITHQDIFMCVNGVDTKRLLFLSRRRVFERVQLLGGNAIIDEKWSCTICKHQTRRGLIYKVSIHYQGTPARCTLPDPQRPIATDEAKGVPGLMTVLSRE